MKKNTQENSLYKATSRVLFLNGFKNTPWELKVVKGQTFNPSIMEPHQIHAMLCENGYYKLTDMSIGKKPFDGIHWDTVLLVLYWQDVEKQYMVISPKDFGKELFIRSYKFEELLTFKGVHLCKKEELRLGDIQ